MTNIYIDGNPNGGLYNYVQTDETLPLSTYNASLCAVISLSPTGGTLQVYRPNSALKPFTHFEANKGYIVLAHQPFFVASVNLPPPVDYNVGDFLTAALDLGGQNIVARGLGSQPIIKSLNSGSTWLTANVTPNQWEDFYQMNVSDYGNVITLCGPRLFTISRDGGTTWTVVASADSYQNWLANSPSDGNMPSVAMNADGSRMVAVFPNSFESKLHISNDAGLTWTSLLITANGALFTKNRQTVASSADGNTLIHFSGGEIWFSKDRGATWPQWKILNPGNGSYFPLEVKLNSAGTKAFVMGLRDITGTPPNYETALFYSEYINSSWTNFVQVVLPSNFASHSLRSFDCDGNGSALIVSDGKQIYSNWSVGRSGQYQLYWNSEGPARNNTSSWLLDRKFAAESNNFSIQNHFIKMSKDGSTIIASGEEGNYLWLGKSTFFGSKFEWTKEPTSKYLLNTIPCDPCTVASVSATNYPWTQIAIGPNNEFHGGITDKSSIITLYNSECLLSLNNSVDFKSVRTQPWGNEWKGIAMSSDVRNVFLLSHKQDIYAASDEQFTDTFPNRLDGVNPIWKTISLPLIYGAAYWETNGILTSRSGNQVFVITETGDMYAINSSQSVAKLDVTEEWLYRGNRYPGMEAIANNIRSLSSTHVFCMDADSSLSIIFLASKLDNTIHYTLDFGVTWSTTTSPTLSAGETINTIKIQYAPLITIWVGTTNGGIYYANMGQPWTKSNAPDEGWVSITCPTDGGNPSYNLMAACSKNTNKIYVSQNAGVSWVHQNNTPTDKPWTNIVNYYGSVLYAAQKGGKIYTTVNHGGTWTTWGS